MRLLKMLKKLKWEKGYNTLKLLMKCVLKLDMMIRIIKFFMDW